MPITSTVRRAAATAYGSPFIDGPRDVEQVTVDASTLTYADGSGGEVDADGYLIPGTPIQATGSTAAGALVSATSQTAGVVIAPVKVPGLTTVAADATVQAASDFPVAIAYGGLLNRDMVEDNLGRALSTNEIAALKAAGILVSGT